MGEILEIDLKGLKKLIEKLKKTEILVVYFEEISHEK